MPPFTVENIIFVTEIPPVEEYSTIYIGKTEAFEPYGSFAGLAETLDENNQIKTDKAFVMLNATNSNEEIINAIRRASCTVRCASWHAVPLHFRLDAKKKNMAAAHHF